MLRSRFFSIVKQGFVSSVLLALAAPLFAGESDLILPDLRSVSFMGIDGHSLLLGGIVICIMGLVFGLVQFVGLKNLPVHKSMRDVSELIYETCKTYLITQGKFILMLEGLLAVVIIVYFGWLRNFETIRSTQSGSRIWIRCSLRIATTAGQMKFPIKP